MDVLLQKQEERKSFKAEEEARERVFGSRKAPDTPGNKARSRSPSARAADTMSDIQPRKTRAPRSQSPRFPADQTQYGPIEPRKRQQSRPKQPQATIASPAESIRTAVPAASPAISPFSITTDEISAAAIEASRLQSAYFHQQRMMEHICVEAAEHRNMLGETMKEAAQYKQLYEHGKQLHEIDNNLKG